LMEDALTRCLRQRDTHRWIRAYVMDALCAVGVAARHPQAKAWITDLGSLAGRAGMHEFSVHVHLLRSAMGEPDALAAAQALAIGVENGHLHGLIEDGTNMLLDELIGRTTSVA